MCSRILVLVLVVAAAPARADTGAWDGFRTLGVRDVQLSALGYVTTEALRRGGIVDDIVADERITERCGISVECHCESLRQRRLRYGAFGSMGRLGDLWTIELTLVDAHNCTVAATAFASESLADVAVAPRLATLARDLTTPKAAVAETATGTERPIDTTPAVVTTFTRAQLRALQIRSLEHLLPLVPGFDVVDANWGGVILNQGLQNTLLVLANGIPLVNGLTNFRTLGRDFRSSLTHVDRIEIVRGPGAVLWGQNAFLGVVNLITEVPTRREAVVDAGLSIGTLRTEELWARGGQNRGLYTFTASVAAGRRIGPTSTISDSPQAVVGVPVPLPFGNGGIAKPEPDVWLDVLVQVAIRKRIELMIQNLTSDFQYELSPLGPLLDDGSGGYWRKTHRLYSLAATQPLYEEPGATITGRMRASRYEYYSDENFALQPLWPDGPVPAPGRPDLRLGLRSLQGNTRPRVANQLELRVTHDVRREFDSHLTGGIGVLHQHTPVSLATLTGIDEEPTMEVTSFGEREFVTLSSFVLEELVPARWLVIAAGARLQLDRPYDPGDDWRFTANFQGGAAIKRGPLGAKLVYAEGFRPPDAVQLYSQVGTKGNPSLVPEYSRELAAEVHFAPTRELVLRATGNVTRVSDLVVLEPIVGDPIFGQTPINRGTIDIASGSIGAQLATARAPGLAALDGFASYHITALDESDPLDSRIPLARHTAALGVVWRPLPDLSVFARGSFASPRRLNVMTADDPRKRVRTSPTVRSALGVTVTDVFAGTDLELSIDNPLLLEHDAPYQLDGSVARMIERRQGTEVFATIRYDR